VPSKQIYIIGAGPGARDILTVTARDALIRSERVFGAERLLNSFSELLQGKKTDVLVTDESIAAAIRESDEKIYAALVSGDSGFFSLSKRLFQKLVDEARGKDWELEIICGVSSVSYMASKLGVSYEDAAVKSFHGRLRQDSPNIERERLLNEMTGLAAHSRRCFFLTDGIVSPGLIFRVLSERGLGKLRASVGERLSYHDEKITIGVVNDIKRSDFRTPNIVFLENDDVKSHPSEAQDSDFIRGSVPMTKESVRILSLSKLRLKPDAICWDIGAGTGSVSCSMAFAVPYGRVYAVEKDADALSLVRQNKEKFGCYNMEVIEGAAPAAFSTLPPPDSAFIGGSSGAMTDILREILNKNPAARIVINVITLETLGVVQAFLAENRVCGAEIVQISVNEFQKTGKYSLLKAQNPVFIISFGGAE
jgi:precorrin-6Y C5,15-methyltransferase (decarboxylating)